MRKDRWETAVRSIRYLVGISSREFEIPDVVAAVRALAAANEGWLAVGEDADEDDLPDSGRMVEVRLSDGSVLRNTRYSRAESRWLWPAGGGALTLQVKAWREMRNAVEEPEFPTF